MSNPMKKSDTTNLSTILTFIIIYVSNDTLLFGTNANRVFFWAHVGILLGTFLYVVYKVRTLQGDMVIFSVCLILLMFVTQVVNADYEFIKYIYNAFVVLLCLFFSTVIRPSDFYNAFVRIVYWIACFSIVLFLVWTIAYPIVRFFPSITNESGIRYFFAGLGFLEDLNPAITPRMYGIFREPGVFMCFLSLALIFELFFLDQLNIKRVVVVLLATALTFSTAAYLVGAVILGAYFAKQMSDSKDRRHKKFFQRMLLLVLVVVLFFLFFGPEKVMGIVFNKLKVKNSSRDSRFGSIETNLRMFLQNPIFGKGWAFLEDKFISVARLGTYKGGHNTNTFLKFLALYGIAPFLFVFRFTHKFFSTQCKSGVWGLFIVIIWMITLSNEDMTVNILFYLLPLYGLRKELRQERNVYEGIGN